MRFILCLAAGLAAGGCTPAIVGGGENSVVVQYDRLFDSAASVEARAAARCRRSGRVPKLRSRRPVSVGAAVAVFDCVPS